MSPHQPPPRRRSGAPGRVLRAAAPRRPGPRSPRQNERSAAGARRCLRRAGLGRGQGAPSGSRARGRCPGPVSPAAASSIPGSEPAPRAGPEAVQPLPPLLAAVGARAPGGATRSRSRVPRAVPAYCFPEKCREAGGDGKGDLPAVAPRASIVVSNIKLTSSSGKKISLLFSFPPTTSSPPSPPPPA